MSTQEHKTVVQRFVNEFKNGGGSMAPLDNLLASNFVHHFSDPKHPAGREGFKAIASMIFKAFPDVHVTPEFVVVDDDLVVERSDVRLHKRVLSRVCLLLVSRSLGQRTTFTASHRVR
jgi:predicted ester cyclase